MHAPTLIVFAREPVPYQSKTRLNGMIGAQAAAALAGAFTLDALAKARGMRWTRIVIAGSAAHGANHSRYFRLLARRFAAEIVDQGGGNLGARMARAIEPYAAGGAILIGTDTPSLPLRMLQRNVALLRRSPIVLGPSLDGGYYLVGLRGSMPDMFRGIRWGGGSVLSATIARLERLGVRYRLGPAWYDIDRPGDLALLAVHLGRMRGVPCPRTARLLKRFGLLPQRVRMM